jgi:cytochrome c biogenesis protein CcmG/thiol:disulfide interchange protein DsbE
MAGRIEPLPTNPEDPVATPPPTARLPGTTPLPSPVRRPQGSRQVIGPFTLRHLAALGGTLLAVAAALILVTLPIAAPQASPPPVPGASFFAISAPTVGLAIGQKAPEFSGTVDGKTVGLTDLAGSPIRLADLRGHPVWISFWASWCPPCQAETPVLRDVYEAHRASGLALVAISVQETTPDDVRAYAQTYGLHYTIGFDATSAVFKTYQAYGLPTHLFLDGDGIIRAIHLGPVTRSDAEAILGPLLPH